MDPNSDSGLDLTKVVPLALMLGDDEEDTRLLSEMAEDATNYINNHQWCGRVLERFFGLGVGGIVAVFLFKIVPTKNSIDEYIWVVVGDIPPLYIPASDAPNPACALDGYIGAMEEWAIAAMSKRSTVGLVPVAAEATPENGKRLLGRLEFIDKNILRHYQDEPGGWMAPTTES